MKIKAITDLRNSIRGKITGTNIRAQKAFLITDDGRVVEKTLGVENGYFVQDSTCKAFLIDRDCLLPVEGEDGYVAVYFESDAAPINFGARTAAIRKKFYNNIKAIGIESRKYYCQKIIRDNNRNKMLQTVRQILLIFTILTVAVILLSIVISWFTGY